MSTLELDEDLDELSSAEDFLDYFEVDYDPSVVHVNRLHILQRFHDYLGSIEDELDDDRKYTVYRDMMVSAYQDFVKSDALTEKVFKVFKMQQAQTAFVSLDSLVK